MYKHPYEDYQPQHPMLQNFEPTGPMFGWGKKKKAKKIQQQKQAGWRKLVKDYAFMRNKNTRAKDIRPELKKYADEYYNDDGKYHINGSVGLDFDTWALFATQALVNDPYNCPRD